LTIIRYRLPIQLRRLSLLRAFSYVVSLSEKDRKQSVEVPEWTTTITDWKYLESIKLVGQSGFSIRNKVLTNEQFAEVRSIAATCGEGCG